jgi:hypothetical protein
MILRPIAIAAAALFCAVAAHAQTQDMTNVQRFSSTITGNNTGDISWTGLTGNNYRVICGGVVSSASATNLVVAIGQGSPPTWTFSIPPSGVGTSFVSPGVSFTGEFLNLQGSGTGDKSLWTGASVSKDTLTSGAANAILVRTYTGGTNYNIQSGSCALSTLD